MAEEQKDNIVSLINANNNAINSAVKSAGTPAVSTPVYSDANSKLAFGGFPFVTPFIAGVTSTANAAFSVEGSSTGSANELMHQTLVLGSNVTTFTKTGFIRVTVTDDAGNITNGDHFIQIGTLS